MKSVYIKTKQKKARIRVAKISALIAGVVMIAVVIYSLGYNHGRDHGIHDGTGEIEQCINNGASGYYTIDGVVNCIYE